jgi:hypothetical protein
VCGVQAQTNSPKHLLSILSKSPWIPNVANNKVVVKLLSYPQEAALVFVIVVVTALSETRAATNQPTVAVVMEIEVD